VARAELRCVYALAALLAGSQLRAEEDRPFVDIAAEAGVAFQHVSSRTAQKYLPETMSGGVALLDYDSDGLLDIYLVNGAALQDPMPEGATPDKSNPKVWNRLYHNLGNATFEDVTQTAGVAGLGYGQGVAAGDFDNDGHCDLYLTNYRRNVLYRNLGDGRFEDVTAAAGVAGGGWSASAAFFDYDSDGDLDLFVSRYLDWTFETNQWCGDTARKQRAYCHPRYFQPVHHLLYRNDGNGRFTDVSEASGIAASPGKGLGVALADANGDGLLDIFVANDKVAQQLFLANDAAGFAEGALVTGAAFDADGETYSGMGIAAADYDNDGLADLFVDALALQGYALYRNADGFFEYVSRESRIAAISERHSGWGAGFLDYDNDGLLDLFVAQGHVMDNIETTQPGIPYREPFLLMRNTGDAFEEVSAFKELHAGRGAAFGDLDNDGGMDIVVNNNDEPASVLLNRARRGRWLIVDLVGAQSNRDAIGARITLTLPDASRRSAVASAAGSYMSSNDRRVHFGLGAAETVASVEILWPSGRSQTLEGVAADQILKVREPRRHVGN
jgi:hypothetical protein